MEKIVIFHPFPQSRLKGICTKFGTALGVANIITCHVFWWLVKGVDSVGLNFAISYWQAQSLLTQGWCYLTTRDEAR